MCLCDTPKWNPTHNIYILKKLLLPLRFHKDHQYLIYPTECVTHNLITHSFSIPDVWKLICQCFTTVSVSAFGRVRQLRNSAVMLASCYDWLNYDLISSHFPSAGYVTLLTLLLVVKACRKLPNQAADICMDDFAWTVHCTFWIYSRTCVRQVKYITTISKEYGDVKGEACHVIVCRSAAATFH
jgi:hypothetical protein